MGYQVDLSQFDKYPKKTLEDNLGAISRILNTISTMKSASTATSVTPSTPIFHKDIQGRGLADQHPMDAITDLIASLAGKQPASPALDSLASLSGLGGIVRSQGGTDFYLDYNAYALLSNVIDTANINSVKNGDLLCNHTGTASVIRAGSAGGGAYFCSFESASTYSDIWAVCDLYFVRCKTTTSEASVTVSDSTHSAVVSPTGFSLSGGTASQFLKANGTVDTNTYALASALGSYIPLAGSTAVTGAIESASYSKWGNAKIGTWSQNPAFARFGHISWDGATNQGFTQLSSGEAYVWGLQAALNASTGSVFIGTAGSDRIIVSNTGLISLPTATSVATAVQIGTYGKFWGSAGGTSTDLPILNAIPSATCGTVNVTGKAVLSVNGATTISGGTTGQELIIVAPSGTLNITYYYASGIPNTIVVGAGVTLFCMDGANSYWRVI